MDVCPKCHNAIVYGMNCCTGKRVLNIPTEPTLTAQELKILVACEICGFTQGHDQWKHQLIERIEALEKEVGILRQKALKT